MPKPSVPLQRPLTVYKIGGSLFNLPDLPGLIGKILAQRPENAALIIAGGGAAADVIREWDRLYDLGDDTAHNLALDAMDLTALLMKHLVPGSRLVRSPRQVARAAADGVRSILCAGCFVKAFDTHGRFPLAHS